ncbi:hypothetical protein E2320_007601 [Naja naja]|nr:hypothetical protein E2320_007601 [Naja naja]
MPKKGDCGGRKKWDSDGWSLNGGAKGSPGVTDHSFTKMTRREAEEERRSPNGGAAVQLARFLERRSRGLSRARRASSGAKLWLKEERWRDLACSATTPPDKKQQRTRISVYTEDQLRENREYC